MGLIVGYLVFGRVAGEYVSVINLITAPSGWVDEVTDTLTGIRQVRQHILATGAAGLALGSVVAAILARR